MNRIDLIRQGNLSFVGMRVFYLEDIDELSLDPGADWPSASEWALFPVNLRPPLIVYFKVGCYIALAFKGLKRIPDFRLITSS